MGEEQRQHVSPRLRTDQLNPTEIRTAAELTEWGKLVFGRWLVALRADRAAAVVGALQKMEWNQFLISGYIVHSIFFDSLSLKANTG